MSDEAIAEMTEVVAQATRKVAALLTIIDAYERALEDKNARIPTYLHAAIEQAKNA